MKNKQFYILLVLILALGAGLFYQITAQPKIGVVDFNRLVLEYDGMKEAMSLYEEKAKKWEAKSDSLTSILQAMIYDVEKNEYSAEELVQKQQNIQFMNNYVARENQQLALTAQEEDEKLTSGVINQIIESTDEYAKQNGFDIIYGKNDGDYIVYKSEEYDITNSVLTYINNVYNGE